MRCTVSAIVNDSQYMIAPSLQQGFIDKDSGELLSAGIVTFYRDVDHSQKKPVYAISGPPDAPIFTELPNPLILSAIGTFQDPSNNQDIIPYYRPFDDDGNIDLYYITVYSATNVFQFSRDHYPTVADVEPGSITQVENFIPDGQFLLHENLPDDGLVNSNGVYGVAYGGWQFNLTGTSTNFITFPRFDAPINNPEANPRYACAVQCTIPNPADSQKDLSLYIYDVNFMQGQDATYQITAFSNDGGSYNVQLIIRKYFGAGGSATSEFVLATYLVTPQMQNFLTNFTVSSNIGQTLGVADDDSFEILLRMPLSSPFNMSFTDAIFIQGTFSILSYPNVTPEMTKAFALPASFDIPAYDGSDVGKFVSLGTSVTTTNKLAFIYANAVPTGTIIMSAVATPSLAPAGFLYCDGGNGALGLDINTYPDLHNVLGFAWGTGINGFCETIGPPAANQYYRTWNRFDVSQPSPDVGTSGFVFSVFQACTPMSLPQIILWSVNAASSITPGSYYRQLVNTSGPQVIQLFWFTVDGAGTIPSVPYTVAVKIALSSSDTAQNVRDKLRTLANGLFNIPDLRGYLPRFVDGTSGRDPDTDSRSASQYLPAFPYLVPSGNGGDNVASVQFTQNLSHTHTNHLLNNPSATPLIISQQGSSTVSSVHFDDPGSGAWHADDEIVNDNSGGNQSNPINVYVLGFIKT